MRSLRRDRRGLAAIEFAYVLPLLTVVIFYGLEIANFAITRERISELAMQLSDNASRIGAQSTLSNKPITEAEINDLFIGAVLQAQGEDSTGRQRNGKKASKPGDTDNLDPDIDIEKNGRIILSSLEVNSKGGQWIHWQRCYGAKTHPSSYGKEGDGKDDLSFAGMGPATSRIKALPGMAVMFVELSVDYKPLISSYWAPAKEITDVATFNVRDDRDLVQIYNPDGVKPSLC